VPDGAQPIEVVDVLSLRRDLGDWDDWMRCRELLGSASLRRHLIHAIRVQP
jgi:hypothetical protein